MYACSRGSASERNTIMDCALSDALDLKQFAVFGCDVAEASGYKLIFASGSPAANALM